MSSPGDTRARSRMSLGRFLMCSLCRYLSPDTGQIAARPRAVGNVADVARVAQVCSPHPGLSKETSVHNAAATVSRTLSNVALCPQAWVMETPFWGHIGARARLGNALYHITGTLPCHDSSSTSSCTVVHSRSRSEQTSYCKLLPLDSKF